jgi:hypothetical protein|tara:strand:- start:1571 stop:2251 length:681 start_codon:yes stop_codon:yes gene_type:complete
MSYKLLVETPASKEEFEYVLEESSKDGKKNLFIKGPYMMAEEVNRNKRYYPTDELKREIARYKSDMINENRSMGELNHPTTAEVDLERACHIVTDIWQEGNMFYGKSKVLSTPCGQIVKSLINDGVKVGMSSRALGQLTPIKEKTGVSKVTDMKLVAVDCVSDPSCPKAFVNGILESKQFIMNKDGKFEEAYSTFEKSLETLPTKELDAYLGEQVLTFLDKIGSKA